MSGPDLSTEQAMPTPNGSPSVQGMVRADLETREQIGVERYGTALQPHNGRDALRDLYEELLDAACYARQAIAERPREDVDAAVAEVQRRYDMDRQRWTDLEAEFRRQLDMATRVRDEAVATARRVPGLLDALRWANEALGMAPQTCRYHGTAFDRLGMRAGQPNCESCRAPYVTTVALRHVLAALGHPQEEVAKSGQTT